MDHPYELLRNPDGVFCKMVAKTGRATSELLHNVAKEVEYQFL